MTDTVPIRLNSLGVVFGPYDSVTARAGDFDFNLTLYAGPLGFFARSVPDPQGNLKVLPSYDFYVAAGTVIHAPADGVVAWVATQPESQDYEILIRKSSKSPWWYDYDHLSKVYVDSGQAVHAGDAIGIVREFTQNTPRGNEHIGFVELMVGDDRTKLSYCPLDYMVPAADSTSTAISRLLRDWRSHGHATPDTTGFYRPGCLAKTAVP